METKENENGDEFNEICDLQIESRDCNFGRSSTRSNKLLGISGMPYKYLIFLHLFTVLPAFLFGAFLLFSTKGTKLHKAFGKLYAILILVTVLTTLAMPAEVGPRFFGHFGYTHLLSFYALYALVAALFAVYRGDIESHRKNMIGLYIGGILVAGAFAFMPGRVIHNYIFS